MRIGIFGGTFDPPHIGHIQAAKYAVQALNLDKLLLMPACVPPKQEKKFATAPEHRLNMLTLALRDEEKTVASDLEIYRGGVSYTWESLQQVKSSDPTATCVMLFGTDAFLSLPKWENSDYICANAEIAVFDRGRWDMGVLPLAEQMRQQGITVHLLENPAIKIASGDIRRMLPMGCGSEFLLPQVLDYIRDNGLYGTGDSLKALPEEMLQKRVISLLRPDRVNHVLGCREAAVALAKHWGANVEDAARAALLHDITKALDGPLQITLCRHFGEALDSFSVENPKTLHALTGSLVARYVFGENPAVVSAIRSHTTGKADMNLLEKIIYVADYMEPNRKFDGVEELRTLAYADIDRALALGLEMTLAMLKEQGREISPASQQALAYLKSRERINLC